jgi:hypothetical protein
MVDLIIQINILTPLAIATSLFMMHVTASELDLYKPLKKQESAMDQDKSNKVPLK